MAGRSCKVGTTTQPKKVMWNPLYYRLTFYSLFLFISSPRMFGSEKFSVLLELLFCVAFCILHPSYLHLFEKVLDCYYVVHVFRMSASILTIYCSCKSYMDVFFKPVMFPHFVWLINWIFLIVRYWTVRVKVKYRIWRSEVFEEQKTIFNQESLTETQ